MPSAFSALPSGENVDLSPQIYVATITTFALATIVVPLRIYCRRLTSTALWWDDYFILIAYVCNLFFSYDVEWAIIPGCHVLVDCWSSAAHPEQASVVVLAPFSSPLDAASIFKRID